MSSDEVIHDRGRGPEIKGTRITVYDVLDYMIAGWHPERIADFLRVHPEEAQAAMEYVREHKLEVLREYLKMLERDARGNSREIQAKLEANRPRITEKLKQLKEQAHTQEAADAGAGAGP